MAESPDISKLIFFFSYVVVLTLLMYIGPTKSQAQAGTLADDEGEGSYFDSWFELWSDIYEKLLFHSSEKQRLYMKLQKFSAFDCDFKFTRFVL